MKSYIKKVFANGVCMRDWLTLDEQQELENGLGNFDGYQFLAQQRKSNAEFWVTGAIALTLLGIGIVIVELFKIFI